MSCVLDRITQLRPVRGRMEYVSSYNGADIFVDYAHTPGALQTVLTQAPYERKLVLFGCGGERFSHKRVEMGAIAAQLADYVIITDDNPRNEDPALIRDEIYAGAINQRDGAHKTYIECIAGRAEAISQALTLCSHGMAVIVAGKGHEQYQDSGIARTYSCDRDLILNAVHSGATSRETTISDT